MTLDNNTQQFSDAIRAQRAQMILSLLAVYLAYCYHRATLPIVSPRSSVAVVTPRA